MFNELNIKMEKSQAIQNIRKFMLSKTFMAIEFIIAAVFVFFSSKQDFTSVVYGDLLFLGICSFALIVCDDIIATLFPFLMIASMSIKCYDSFDIFIKFVWLLPVLAFALLFHFIVYHRKFELGATWKGIVFVAVAVTMGGVGKITATEYFNGTALFYTIGLGFGMFAIYLLMNSQYHVSEKYNLREYFSWILTVVGLFCVFMLAHHYGMNWESFLKKGGPLNFQWRNNVSTILMLTFPFAFFLSSKKYPFIFAGFLQYVGIMFTGSRGGAIFGTAELLLCLLFIVLSDRKNRKKNLIIIGFIAVLLAFFARSLLGFLDPVIDRLANDNSVRLGLITRAVEDFKSNVLFGRGLGYMGNTDVHDPAKFALCWYHSAPFQVIGSFGLLGILAFSYQLFNRMRVVWKRITIFNLVLFTSYAGLFMMSLVNPGEFSPIPYGMIATLLFIICDKNNKGAASDFEKEEVFDIKKLQSKKLRENFGKK